MKKTFLIILVLSVISCSKKESSVDFAIIDGKIENVTGNIFSVRNSEGIVKDVKVNKDGSFSDTVKNIETGYYFFKYNNETSNFYLSPGYNISLSLDTKEFDESIKYSGKGSAENNYLAKKYLNEEGLGDLGSYKYLGTLDENTYIHLVDSIKKLELDYLSNQNNIDDSFLELEKESIAFNWVNEMSRYELYKRYVSGDKDFHVSENYPDYYEGVDLEDESLLGVRNYVMVLSRYYNKEANKIIENEGLDNDIAYLKTINDMVKSPKVKEKLLYGAARYGITYTKSVQEYYDIFMSGSTSEEHKNDITSKYNKIIKLHKGQQSPKFVNYENYNGGKTSLDDLRGKFVYIDVWATWCGPCIREIPYLKEVEKKYHNNNVTFVSLSVDAKSDYNKWRAMIVEKELGGVQLIADKSSNSDFYKEYGIMGIPRFILIDPEGNIVDANAPNPSSSDLIKLFDELNI